MPGTNRNRKPPRAGMGRPKGSKNKIGKQLREVLADFAEANVGSLQGLYDRVKKRNPERALMIYAQIVEFTLPKLNRTQIELPAAPPPALGISFADGAPGLPKELRAENEGGADPLGTDEIAAPESPKVEQRVLPEPVTPPHLVLRQELLPSPSPRPVVSPSATKLEIWKRLAEGRE